MVNTIMANFYRPESLAEWAKARPCLPGPPPADPPLRGGEAGAVGLAAQPAELPATGALRRCYTPRGQPKRKVLEIEGGAKQFDRPADEAAGGRREIRAREGQFAILCGERAAAAGTAAAGCPGARCLASGSRRNSRIAQSRTMTLPDCRYVPAPLLGVGRGFLAPWRYRASLDWVDRPSLIGRMATNSIAEMACYPPVVCLRVASSAWGPVYLET
jgi:hypothetical protein